MSPNLRGYLYGTGLMAVVSATSFTLGLAGRVANWHYYLLGSIFLAGVVTALIASFRRVLLALAQLVPALLIVLAVFAIGARYDTRWENLSVKGAAIRALSFAPAAAILCAAGGGIGWLLTRRRTTPNKSLERTRGR